MFLGLRLAVICGLTITTPSIHRRSEKIRLLFKRATQLPNTRHYVRRVSVLTTTTILAGQAIDHVLFLVENSTSPKIIDRRYRLESADGGARVAI